MRILSIEIKNFRCFPIFKHTFSGSLTLIEGPNGSGKTSLLEALHYACYGKSFRTSLTEEMLRHSTGTLFIKLETEEDDDQHTIQIGFSEDTRSIKVNGQKIATYKELLQHYRTITITEDDILIVKGYPEFRRTFLDQSLVMHQPEAATLLKRYRAVLKQRTALLASDITWNQTSYELWTEKLWLQAQQIVDQRITLLSSFEEEVNSLICKFFTELPPIKLAYRPSAPHLTLEQWVNTQSDRERSSRRTLFGPHLDDFEIHFDGQSSKTYASRGQQKLIAVLLKAAHFFLLSKRTGRNAIILLDDFMTDFDDARAQALIDLFIEKKVHLICTVPTQNSPLACHLKLHGAEHLVL